MEARAWFDYESTTIYSQADAERKTDLVRQSLGRRRTGLVWDLGCDDGRLPMRDLTQANGSRSKSGFRFAVGFPICSDASFRLAETGGGCMGLLRIRVRRFDSSRATSLLGFPTSMRSRAHQEVRPKRILQARSRSASRVASAPGGASASELTYIAAPRLPSPLDSTKVW
jgi:hypothetical protein